MKRRLLFALIVASICFSGALCFGNVAGGVGREGKLVTVNSDAKSLTLSNGIVSIVCDKSSGAIHRINYTYDNGAGETTLPLLGGKRGGEFYWELGGVGGSPFQCTVVVNPAVGDLAHAKGEYAEVAFLGPSPSSGLAEIHYSILRGSPGFYITLILRHRKADKAMGLGEIRTNVYLSPTFTWQSVDQERSHQWNIGGKASGVAGAPKECYRWTSGFAAGQFEDKYKWSAHFGEERAWGWSSVTNGPVAVKGNNVGVWNVLGSAEYYIGGPLKPDLMDAPMVNMFNSSHYQMGMDNKFDAGEEWTKTYGPFFFYCNNIPRTVSDPSKAAAALFADARAQAAAEQSAWPYKWFVNPAYAPATGRGKIKGRIVIDDRFNPDASPADLWVGVARKPRSIDGVIDFQQWAKPYQFWVKTDAKGNFVIPGVIAADDYTLFAFGSGAAGTFQSQSLGSNAPINLDFPTPQFSVDVRGGGTRDLGSVRWTPTRVGPTVFELGYPDRTARKFRHGDDYWSTDTTPDPAAAIPVWTGFLKYRFDFPDDPHYVVGKSRWPTDWNFIQPVVPDDHGSYAGSMSTLTFDLAAAPPKDAKASLYLALASDYLGPLIIRLNDTELTGPRGYMPYYNRSDTSIREEINGAFSDSRFAIPASLLKKGSNTITFDMRRGGYFANHAMYDYLRLELAGYVPPAPATIIAYAGNNRALVRWPVVPGATSYNVLRRPNDGSGYSVVAAGVMGPVCGSGPTHASYLDTTASNATSCVYAVQSVNAVGVSASSKVSDRLTPSTGAPIGAPPVPQGMAAVGADHLVTLRWNPSPGANFYTVQRCVLVNDGGGALVPLAAITLDNAVEDTNFADSSCTNGTTYGYVISASNAAGTSADCSPAIITLKPAVH
jgi:rhamnogalacturonan endolyase